MDQGARSRFWRTKRGPYLGMGCATWVYPQHGACKLMACHLLGRCLTASLSERPLHTVQCLFQCSLWTDHKLWLADINSL